MSRATFFVAAMLVVACAPARSPDEPAIAHVEHDKCGTCHVEVQPGTRSRDVLEKAFVRHRKRVKLSEEQWAAMVDYLAVRSEAASSTHEDDGGRPVR